MALSPKILRDFVSAIPSAKLHTIRKPGFWSIFQHVAHLADVQPMIHARLVRFRDEESPNFVPYLPSSDDIPEVETSFASIQDACEGFDEWRRKTLDLAREMPESYWQKRGGHPEFEVYTPLNQLRHLLMHDHWHMYRIEELWLTRDQFLTDVQ